MIKNQPPAATEVEQVLHQIPDLIAARVVSGDDQDMREIHVLATPGREAKQIVRDIERLLQERYNVKVDHKRISIAQLADPDERRSGRRLRLQALHVRARGDEVDLRVDLTRGEEMIPGAASGPGSRLGRLRLAAAAVLEAVAEMSAGRFACVVEDAAPVAVAGRPAVVVCITLVTRDGEEVLTGAAYNRGDEAEAAVKATLDAMNRRLEKLLA